LWVAGPNGFVREFRGASVNASHAIPEVQLEYDSADLTIELIATNEGRGDAALVVRANAYRADGPWRLHVPHGAQVTRQWSVVASQHWYDFTVTGADFERRFAGRLENGAPSFSDPAI